MPPSPRQDGDRLTIESLIDPLVSNDMQALLCIPAEGSLGRWLQLHDQNTTAWQKRQLAQIIDPDAHGFADRGDAPLHLSAAIALRFYGYPNATNAAQRGVLIDALRQHPGFAETDLHRAFACLHADLKTLANAVQTLISNLDLEQATFNRLHLDQTHCHLTSGSYWHMAMNRAAQWLQTVVSHPWFQALEHVRELIDHDCVFDPATGAISGPGILISHTQLLSLPLDAGVDALTQLGEQLRLVIRLDARFSLAQLLTLLGLPLPATRDAAWDLIEQLQHAEPLELPPACDLANSDIALAHYAQAKPTPGSLKPRWGNYWECLQPGVLTLSADQRVKVIATASAWLRSADDTLLASLWPTAVSGHPDDCLHRLLNSSRAQTLAHRLINTVGWYGHAPGETGNRAARDALVLAALILSLDPKAGEVRYRVAGLDLNQTAWRGRSFQRVRSELELHLIDRGVANARTCALAAHLLLSGVAPECLVQGIPESVYFMRSYAWIVLRQGALQACGLACGLSRHLTFSDIVSLATEEAPAAEQPWREQCATAALIDWAGDRQAYAPADLEALKQQLAVRLQALKQASTTLTTPLTTRRAIALADLQRVFAGQPLLDAPCVYWAGGPTKPPPFRPEQGHTQLSLTGLHMSGHLQPLAPQWRSCSTRLPLAELNNRFAELGQVETLFTSAATAHIAQLKLAYALAIHYVLWQLPLADRQFLERADLQLLVLRLPAKGPLADESVAAKMARTGRFGVLVRGTYAQQVHYYELFPLINQVEKNPRLPALLTLGGQPLVITSGSPTSAQPRSVLYTGSLLAIDWDAYATGSPPRAGQHATVIADLLTFNAPEPGVTALGFDSPRSHAIAQTIVDHHFFLDVDSLLATARGANKIEVQQRSADALTEAILNLIPFRACARGLASGDTRQVIDAAWSCFFDITGLFTPTRAFGTGALSGLRKAVPAAQKLWLLSRLSAAYLNAAFNPLESVPSLLRLGHQGLVKLNRAGAFLMDNALGHARRRLAQGRGLDYSRLIDRADVGSAHLVHADGLTRLQASKRLAHWYAFDPFSARPYGPPIKGLRLDSALGVSPFENAAGYKALVVEPLFDTPPLIILRAEATDLLHDHRVWRLTPDHTGQLDDITSPAHLHLADAFEPSCTSGRSKRSPANVACYSKKLYRFVDSIHKRRAQALDHIRLIPSPSHPLAQRKVVMHRRRYTVTPAADAFELTPQPQHQPLIYKQQVTARRIDDEPQFGLPGDELDNLLERQTQVVTLAGLVEGIDDQRTLRALDVTLPGVTTRPYWVVEADTGLFYRATPLPRGPAVLLFEQLDYSRGGDDRALIDAFCAWRNGHLSAGGMIPDQPLIALPTLDTLYQQLVARGVSAERMARLRDQASRLSLIKQRELLFNVADQGQALGIHIASKPVQLNIWPPRPSTPGIPSAEQINRHMAEHASISTCALVEKTGLGSANLVATTPADMRRLQITEPVVMWEYSKVGHANYTEVILKTGAGNCDQMAHVACEMIRHNGGTAHIWHTRPPAHAFVVVGPRPGPVANTVDFSEASWATSWVCDPWTAITCPARDYITELQLKMITWDLQHISVFFHDASRYRWGKATDPQWLGRLTESHKVPRS